MSKTTPEWSQEIGRRRDSLVALRRDFHRHPELSFEERRTAEIIAQRLDASGIEVRTGVGRTGVVGVLNGERPGRTSDAQVTLHKNNVGLGIADAGIAMRAYELAKESGRGIPIDIPAPGAR